MVLVMCPADTSFILRMESKLLITQSLQVTHSRKSHCFI